VYALETATGNLAWSTELPGAMAGSPVLSEDGSTLYVGNFDYNLYALDASTGGKRWQVASQNWIWSQPVLAGDKLFFADLGGYVYAVDPQSGDVLWSDEVADAIRGMPAYDAENRVLYVAGRKVANPGNVSTRGVVRALDVDSYTTLWEQSVDEAVYTGPILSDGLLLVTPLQGDTLMQVYNADTGVLQWQFIPNPES
jgi:outer membrane protein assembly factor BamB